MNYYDYDTLKFQYNLNFQAKILKIQHFSTLIDSVNWQNHYFWRENPNYPSISGFQKFSKIIAL